MQLRSEKWRVRAGPVRIVLWSLAGLILIGLFTLDIGSGTSRFDRARDAASDSDDGESEDSDLTTRNPEMPPRVGAPVARFGVLDRQSHLPVLSGLFMNAYALAAQADGWIDHKIFERASLLVSAIEDGEIDVAALPLRDAARLAASGDATSGIVILAGISLGDERIVVRPEVKDGDLKNRRVAVLEAPTLDVMKRLGLDGPAASEPPQVLLKAYPQIGPALLARELDAAILSEPYATAVAERIGGKSLDLDAEGGGGGAVLVMTRAFYSAHAALAERLVQMHEVSTYMIDSDPATAIARTRQILLNEGFTPPDDTVYVAALGSVRFGTDVPRAPLESLLRLAGAPDAEIQDVLDRTIDLKPLEVARAIRKEALEAEDGR